VFRYNVGSGVAEIASTQPVVLNAWNTIHIRRTDNEGTLVVNDVDVAKGIAPGSETRLRLGPEVLLGGLHEYGTVTDLDFNSGFVGRHTDMQQGHMYNR
jgi:coxsackievirus/adenovirus receptor